MLLPAGVKPGLTPGELKEAYYHSFNKKNHLAFIQAGHNYDSATMDTSNDFMKIRQEMEHIDTRPMERRTNRNNSSHNDNHRNIQDNNCRSAGGRDSHCQDNK